jgi:hypothetical protein
MTENMTQPASPAEPESRWTRLLQRPVSLKIAMAAILAALLLPVLFPVARFLHNLCAWKRIEAATLSILKGENLAFLVTDKLTSQITVEVDEHSPLLGRREGVLIGTVTLYYGVDVQALDASCLSQAGGRMIVRLPEPRELDFALDPASFRYITKRSGWNVVVDYVRNRDLEAELRRDIHRHALAFFAQKQLLPTRAKIVHQLNELATPLSRELGVPIVFQ